MTIKRKFIALAAVLGAIAPAHAAPGDILVRLRATYTDRSSGTHFPVVIGTEGKRTKPSGSAGIEGSLTFFIDNTFAIEAALGGSRFKLKSQGDGFISAGAFEPTIAAIAYPAGVSGKIRPYIGAGLVYRKFHGEKVGALILEGSRTPRDQFSVSVSSDIAPVGKIGADIAINDRSYINVEGRYSQMNTSVGVFDGGPLRIRTEGKLRDIGVAVGAGFVF